MPVFVNGNQMTFLVNGNKMRFFARPLHPLLLEGESRQSAVLISSFQHTASVSRGSGLVNLRTFAHGGRGVKQGMGRGYTGRQGGERGGDEFPLLERGFAAGLPPLIQRSPGLPRALHHAPPAGSLPLPLPAPTGAPALPSFYSLIRSLSHLYLNSLILFLLHQPCIPLSPLSCTRCIRPVFHLSADTCTSSFILHSLPAAPLPSPPPPSLHTFIHCLPYRPLFRDHPTLLPHARRCSPECTFPSFLMRANASTHAQRQTHARRGRPARRNSVPGNPPPVYNCTASRVQRAFLVTGAMCTPCSATPLLGGGGWDSPVLPLHRAQG